MNFEQNPNLSEVRNANVYKIDRFSENIILFGVSVGSFLFLDFIFNNLLFSISILLSGIFFYIVESKISQPIKDILNTSIYYQSKPKILLFWGVLSFFLFLIFIVVYNVFSIPDELFLDYYIKSIFLSGVFFMLSDFLIAFLILTSLVDSKLIRRGFFAIFQRGFILVRCIAVTPLWRKYIEEKFSFFTVCVYIIIKAALLVMVISEIIDKWKIFIENKKKLFIPVPEQNLSPDAQCPFCFCYPIEPIILLPCHHVTCYACINQWAKAKSRNLICPLCRHPLECPTQIEMNDAYFSLSMLFVSF